MMVEKKVWNLYERNYHKIKKKDLGLLIKDIENRVLTEFNSVLFLKRFVKVGTLIHENFKCLGGELLSLYNAAETGISQCSHSKRIPHNFKYHFHSYAGALAGELYKLKSNSSIDWATISYNHYIECINGCLRNNESGYAMFNFKRLQDLTNKFYNNEGGLDYLIKNYNISKDLVKLVENKESEKTNKIVYYRKQLNNCLLRLIKETGKNFWVKKSIINGLKILQLEDIIFFNAQVRKQFKSLSSDEVSSDFCQKIVNELPASESNNLNFTKGWLLYQVSKNLEDVNLLYDSYFNLINSAIGFESGKVNLSIMAYRFASKTAYEVFKNKGFIDWLETTYDLRVKAGEINDQSGCFDEYYAGKTALKLYDNTSDSGWLACSWRETIKSFNEFDTLKHKVEAHRQLEEIIHRLKE